MSWVVVTGGAQGIGLAIVKRFLEEGWGVVVVDLQGEPPGLRHAKLRWVTGDASARDTIEGACRLAAEKSGGNLAAFVANAAVHAGGESMTFGDEEWDQVFRVNVTGVFRGAQAARRYMEAGGSMVFMSSIVSRMGLPERAAYCASKASVDGLMRALAVEWGPAGVRVNSVAPGGTRTEMLAGVLEGGADLARRYTGQMPLRRLADPAEIASAVFFLASSQSSDVTGVSLPVDGGWAIQGVGDG